MSSKERPKPPKQGSKKDTKPAPYFTDYASI